MRALRNLGLLVQEPERPLGAREVGLQARRLAADRLERLVQLLQVAPHHVELTQRQHAAAHMAQPDEQHGRLAERARHADERAIAAFQPRQPDTRCYALPRAPYESIGLAGLLAKRLHDAQRAERLLHHRERRAFEFLGLT